MILNKHRIQKSVLQVSCLDFNFSGNEKCFFLNDERNSNRNFSALLHAFHFHMGQIIKILLKAIELELDVSGSISWLSVLQGTEVVNYKSENEIPTNNTQFYVKEVEFVSTETILSCILLYVQESLLFCFYFLSFYEW